MTPNFRCATPIFSGVANRLIPLMLGVRDMAFSRPNAFTYRVLLFSGLLLWASFVMGSAPHAGWFAYAPHTEAQVSRGPKMDCHAPALVFLAVSQTAGAIDFVVTELRHRKIAVNASRARRRDDRAVLLRQGVPLL